MRDGSKITRVSVARIDRPRPKSAAGVKTYRATLRAGGKLDPIMLIRYYGGGFRVADGMHRLAASIAEERKTILATIIATDPHPRRR